MQRLRVFIVFWALFFVGVWGEEQPELLRVKDIHLLMKEIFRQHVDKKEMSIAILRHSLKAYIDQFDPDGIYLLDDEVRPYLSLSNEKMEEILKQYEREDLTVYQTLNKTIQNAILRSRQYRKELFAHPDQLFLPSRSPREEYSFAKTPEELKQRIRADIQAFIDSEIHKYGESSVLENKSKTLNLYNQDMLSREDSYLAVESNGTPLSASEKENLFVLHVLKSIAKSLDSHTNFLNVNEAYEMRIHLEKRFYGIGVHLQHRNHDVAVVGLVENGPAAKSERILIGDRIVKIDGHPIRDEPFEHVMELLHAQTPTVTLELKRQGDLQREHHFTVKLQRTVIPLNEGRVESTYEKFDNGIIGIVTLPAFYKRDESVSSEIDLREAIKKLKTQGELRGLIIDLRHNTGGFLAQAVKVAGLFITSGVIVISKYSSGEEKIYRDMDGKISFDGPLVLLTSRETASAAEIVAQALQDYGVALVVGDEHTYGKGTIQSQTVTGGGSTAYFKVTVGKYYTVSGKTPQLQGVRADLIVPSHRRRDEIGEEYLEYSLSPDTIPPSYDDKLTDVEPQLRSWYLRYYAPTIQHKKNMWRELLPTLRHNSFQRLARANRGPSFLPSWFGEQPPQPSTDFDPQMTEAINVVKDMISF